VKKTLKTLKPHYKNLQKTRIKKVRHSRNTENNLFGLGKRSQGILRNQSTRGFFGFEFNFQNCFWNLFSTFSLPQICKIRNVWKLPSLFSMNTLIPCSEKTFKNIILEEKLPNKFKYGHKKLLPRNASL
jgi:hypothetical protein